MKSGGLFEYHSPHTARFDIPVVRFVDGVELFGGFEVHEHTVEERGDPAGRWTTLCGEKKLHGVVVGASFARLDGFRIEHGRAPGNTGELGDPTSAGARVFVRNNPGFHVANCEIVSNEAHFGAGMAISRSDGVKVLRTAFEANFAEKYGGLGTDFSDDILVEDCRFADNIAYPEDGGAIGTEFSSVTVRSCQFIRNAAEDMGGAVYVRRRDPSERPNFASVADCRFEDNESTGLGAGVYVSNRSELEVLRSWFENNSSYEGGSGVAGSTIDPTLRVEYCTFVGNDSHGEGEDTAGGTVSSAGTVLLAHNRFYRNHSAWTAAGFSVRGDRVADITLINNLFVHNVSDGPGAFVVNTIGAQSDTQGSLFMVNSTFVANRGDAGSPAVYAENPASRVYNSVYLGTEGLEPMIGQNDIWRFDRDSCRLDEAAPDVQFDVVKGLDGLNAFFLKATSGCVGIGDPERLARVADQVAFNWEQMTTQKSGVVDGMDLKLDPGFHWPAAHRASRVIAAPAR